MEGEGSIVRTYINTLLLLGFNEFVQQEKAASNRSMDQVDLSPTMFHRSNEVSLHAILYFLFSKLDPSLLRQYRVCWPVLDSMTRKDFRKVTLDILKDMEEKGHLPRGSSRPSLLQSPQGVRVEELIWHLSTYVLRSVMEKEGVIAYPMPNWNTTTNHKSLSVFAQGFIVDSKILFESRCFREKAMRSTRDHNLWEKEAGRLTCEYRRLNEESKEVKKEWERVREGNGGVNLNSFEEEGTSVIGEIKSRSETGLERTLSVPQTMTDGSTDKVSLAAMCNQWSDAIKDILSFINGCESPEVCLLPQNSQTLDREVSKTVETHTGQLNSLHQLSVKVSEQIQEIEHVIQEYQQMQDRVEDSPNRAPTNQDLIAPTPMHTYVPKKLRPVNTPGGPIGSLVSPAIGLKLKRATGGILQPHNIEASVRRKASRAIPKNTQDPICGASPTPRKVPVTKNFNSAANRRGPLSAARRLTFSSMKGSGGPNLSPLDSSSMSTIPVVSSVGSNMSEETEIKRKGRVTSQEKLNKTLGSLARKVAFQMTGEREAVSPGDVISGEISQSIEDAIGFQAKKEIARTPLLEKRMVSNRPVISSTPGNKIHSQARKSSMKLESIPGSPLVSMIRGLEDYEEGVESPLY